jgi:hypothetical protein
MADTPKRDDELTEAEKQKRFTRTLKRMLETPPKPHVQPRKVDTDRDH